MENLNSTVKLKVVGVGGAGGNAINDMIESNITTVEFIAINTDQQDLDRSKATSKVLLGRGTGAGADPEKGRSAARDSEDKIKEVLEGTDMLFITAGMGGGTGTGASPIIAEVAKSMGILTVAVVTKPFSFEGPIKKITRLRIKNLKENVDTLIAIPNDKLFEIPGMNITLLNAFKEANGILKIGIKGISDLIMKQGTINLDFADIRSIMQNSGIAMLGFGEANGDEKAKSATAQALNSPLLEKSIEGARKILINITGGPDVSLNEVNEVANTVTAKAGSEPNLIWGYILDEELEGTISVSIVATDFQDNLHSNIQENNNSKTVRFAPEIKKEEIKPLSSEEEKQQKSDIFSEKDENQKKDFDDEDEDDDDSMSDFVLPPFFQE
ncbi:cell division protein FtsZ [Leptotrichia sp. HSP-334]|uniref:Cell division protein FtsZ n=1 Tax=Leptotrichia rugosa TaxID=3239302 RepID=A0AB39VGX9_9FUSO